MIFHAGGAQAEFQEMKRGGWLANFTLEKCVPETQAGGTGLQARNFEWMATQIKNWFKSVLQTAAFFGAYLFFAVRRLAGQRGLRGSGHVISRERGRVFLARS